MEKESIIELQKIDCNCNNCKYMVRDFAKFEISLQDHHRWQLEYFLKLQLKKIERAIFQTGRNDFDSAKIIFKEVQEAKFQFNKGECRINFGNCTKLGIPVSFIPDTCQLDTQSCFEHRSN